MALAALVISLLSAAISAVVGGWVAIRSRLRVKVSLVQAGMASVGNVEALGMKPVEGQLAKVRVNIQGKALSVEDIEFEWVSPMPGPEGWGWGAPTLMDLGFPEHFANIPSISEMTSPIPPQPPYTLQDGETKVFTVWFRLNDKWGDGTEPWATLKARVTLSNRKKPYVTDSRSFAFRPALLPGRQNGTP